MVYTQLQVEDTFAFHVGDGLQRRCLLFVPLPGLLWIEEPWGVLVQLCPNRRVRNELHCTPFRDLLLDLLAFETPFIPLHGFGQRSFGSVSVLCRI